MKIINGCRSSPLALWQAQWVRDRLAQNGAEVEIRTIRTSGDRLANVSLAHSGTKGLFIKEIEDALLTGAIDIAVHSLKDLPTEQPRGLVIAAIPEREDVRDALVARNGASLSGLAPGAKVGTSSLRRQAQLKWARPDLVVVPMRGNVDTRLKKLDRGDCDALLLAAAGLNRLGFVARISELLPPDVMCPAVGQGALAIEAREDTVAALEAVRPLDHASTHISVRAERSMLRNLGGGCDVPIAAHAWLEAGELKLRGVVASPDGTRLIHTESSGSCADPETLGAQAARDLVRQGARDLLIPSAAH